MRDALVEHCVDRSVECQRDLLPLPHRRRQRHAGKRAPGQRVVHRPRHQAPQAQPGQSLGASQTLGGEVFHAVHQRTEVLAEQRIGDDPQGGFDHRRVHVELDPWHDVGGDPLDRVDHQVHQFVEMTTSERRIERGAVRGPRVAFVGQQVDTCRGPNRLVFVGLDVLQSRTVQHVVDIVGVRHRHEASSRATESRDVMPTDVGQEAASGVEPDRDCVARHRPGAQPLRRCRHDVNGTSDKTALGMGLSDTELGVWDMASTTWSPDLRHPIYATRLLCEVANERGVATSDILAGTGIAPADLDDPEAVVAASDEIVVVRRLLAALPNHTGLGIDVGSRYRLTHLGLFGFAAMSCATFRELLDVSMRYFSLTMLNVDVKVFEGAESCLLEFVVDQLPLDVRAFYLERDVASIVMTTSDFALPVVARYADQISMEATLDQGVVAPLLALMPMVKPEFARAHNRLYSPRAMPDEPLPQADRHTLDTCLAQCDVLMQRNEQRPGITAVVRSKLFANPAASRRCPKSPPSSTYTRAHYDVS